MKRRLSIGLQILLYPTTVLTDMDFPSRQNFSGYVLTEESGKNVLDYYLPDISDRSNPYASPLLADDHSRLPPAYVMTAAFDPLLDEGLLGGWSQYVYLKPGVRIIRLK